jgi:mRNA-degrading endonuclease RelE of RelBE toxin-antitoxin system
MNYELSKRFIKSFDALPRQIQAKTEKALALFFANPIPPYHPSLRIKKLRRPDNIWEGRVDQFYRFTFMFQKDTDTGETVCIFRNVGRHEIIDHEP